MSTALQPIDDFGADEDYGEEFQEPPLSPCTGDFDSHWEVAVIQSFDLESGSPKRVLPDTVSMMQSPA